MLKAVGSGYVKAAGAAPALLLAEGQAVGALVLGGVALMGAHHDAVQRTVVFRIAVVSALLNGAFDTLVCFAAHDIILL